MGMLEIGGKLTVLMNQPEGTFFEINEAGPVWFFNYAHPSQDEIKDISEGSSFEIRSIVRDNVMWVFVKCGGQEWAEAPYNPHLSKNPELQPITDDSSGYALTLVMVDAETQTVKHLRMIGLGNRFSKLLYSDVHQLMDKPFDSRAYYDAIRRAQLVYSTPQMVKMCKNYWKLR